MQFSSSHTPSYALQQAERNTPAPPPPPAPATPIREEETNTNNKLESALPSPSEQHDQVHELKRQKSRNELFANALFPAAATSVRQPRLSLPLGPTKKQQPRNDRKSLSPRHASSRSATGTLLVAPLTEQFAQLKATNKTLQTQLSSGAATQQAALVRARSRIATLETALVGQEELRTERDGWESEATRLSAEVAALTVTSRENVVDDTIALKALEQKLLDLERLLAKGSEKTKKYKDVNERLRLELETRRFKEKWDLAIIDSEDRDTDIKTTILEFEVSQLRATVALQGIDRVEYEELIESLQTSITSIGAARAALLASSTASQSAAAAAQSELAETTASLEEELARTKDSLVVAKRELIDSNERCEELEAEVDRIEGEAAGIDKVAKITEGKEKKEEVKKLRLLVEEEKTKREIAEAESRSLKSTLKSAQAELKLSEKSLVAATRAAEVATKSAELAQVTLQTTVTAFTVAQASSSVVKVSKPKAAKVKAVPVVATRRRKSLLADMSIEEEEMSLAPSSEELFEEPAPVVVKAVKVKAAPVPRPVKIVATVLAPAPVPAVVVAKASTSKVIAPLSDSESEVDGSVYRPVKKAKALPLAPVIPRAVVVPVVAPVKKPKVPKAVPAAVLASKSTNVKAPKKVSLGTAATAKGKKRELVVEEEEAGPAKKKKMKTLFNKPKAFDWANVVENADVNTLGLPSALSPVKAVSTNKRSSLGLLGKGLTNGRKSIFAD